MSQAFSSSSLGTPSTPLTVEEARDLIRGHGEPTWSSDGHVTVQDLAEALNVSEEQADEMIRNYRARQRHPQPMPNAVWLRTRLWIWVVLALISLSLSGFGIMGKIADEVANAGKPAPNRTVSDGIYSSRVAAAGRALGVVAPPGFSYRIQYGAVDAGVNGDSVNYIDVPDLSPPNVAILQAQMAENMMVALSAAIEKNPPNWVDGRAPAVLIPNYYEGGEGVPFDVTLYADAFPYEANTSKGRQMKARVLSGLQRVWDEVID